MIVVDAHGLILIFFSTAEAFTLGVRTVRKAAARATGKSGFFSGKHKLINGTAITAPLFPAIEERRWWLDMRTASGRLNTTATITATTTAVNVSGGNQTLQSSDPLLNGIPTGALIRYYGATNNGECCVFVLDAKRCVIGFPA